MDLWFHLRNHLQSATQVGRTAEQRVECLYYKHACLFLCNGCLVIIEHLSEKMTRKKRMIYWYHHSVKALGVPSIISYGLMMVCTKNY